MYVSLMTPAPLPPPDPPHIEAVEIRFCPRSDIKCKWETANDLLEGVADSLKSSGSSPASGGKIVDMTAAFTGTGSLRIEGHAPEVIVGQA